MNEDDIDAPPPATPWDKSEDNKERESEARAHPTTRMCIDVFKAKLREVRV